ncbi:DUF423 domain-containing protein [Mangrovibacterium sp.]|uniref:DUF423 domain-containing protein n=1 Tax=Mangrovibacterium sp. TaxID=1961364 RepID=UPI003567809C
MTRTIFLIAAACLAAGVIIGAFGAHGLKTKLSPEMMQVYKTGVEYHFYHAIGLLVVGVLSIHYPSVTLSLSALFLFLGILIFSGSLYLLALTGIKWLGAITPIGGLSFIAGWLFLFGAFWRNFP